MRPFAARTPFAARWETPSWRALTSPGPTPIGTVAVSFPTPATTRARAGGGPVRRGFGPHGAGRVVPGRCCGRLSGSAGDVAKFLRRRLTRARVGDRFDAHVGHRLIAQLGTREPPLGTPADPWGPLERSQFVVFDRLEFTGSRDVLCFRGRGLQDHEDPLGTGAVARHRDHLPPGLLFASAPRTSPQPADIQINAVTGTLHGADCRFPEFACGAREPPRVPVRKWGTRHCSTPSNVLPSGPPIPLPPVPPARHSAPGSAPRHDGPPPPVARRFPVCCRIGGRRAGRGRALCSTHRDAGDTLGGRVPGPKA
jgi:hypothetical protein